MAKTIVITGAGEGLGRALARRFAAEGETTILLGRTASKVEALAGELGAPAMGVGCDVASPDSVRAAFATIAAAHPRIDVLINNAAIFEPFQVVEATDEQVLRAVGTNVAGPIFCTRSAIPLMGPGGHIINLSSESVDVHFPHLSIYQATKAAVERFSKSLQQELEPAGIRVSTVRAGQMMEEGKAWNANPEAAMRFGMAAKAVGLNLMERPISHYKNVTSMFRALLDLPPDVHAHLVTLQGRRADG